MNGTEGSHEHLKRAFAKADEAIIAATSGIKRDIRRFYGRNSTVISEIGLPPVARGVPTHRRPSEPLALLWCGNHLPGKALPFLISALKMLPADLNWRLMVIGDGSRVRQRGDNLQLPLESKTAVNGLVKCLAQPFSRRCRQRT